MKTVTKLSDKLTGTDYLSAYRSRMEVNNQYFLDVAKELTGMGFNVYHPKDGLISFIKVEGNERHIYFGFTDVPYRWYLSYDIDYRKGQGSGRTLKEQTDYDNPFTAQDIISNMQPNAPKQVKSNQYLQLFRINQPIIFESGATSHAVNDLILYTDNTRELAELRNEFYSKAVKDNSETLVKDMGILFTMATQNYINTFGYVSSEHIRGIDANGKVEFIRLYMDDFITWVKEN